jgi:hypothetical protein
MHDMIIQPCMVFVATLTTCLASLWAQGQSPGPAPSEPSWVRGGAYRLRTSAFRGIQIGAEPVLVEEDRVQAIEDSKDAGLGDNYTRALGGKRQSRKIDGFPHPTLPKFRASLG